MHVSEDRKKNLTYKWKKKHIKITFQDYVTTYYLKFYVYKRVCSNKYPKVIRKAKKN